MKRTLMAMIITAAAALPAHAAGEDWVIKDAAGSVDEAVERLVTAVEGAGAKVFATVDHAAGAEAVGAELADMTLVIFGNPKIGTPVIQAEPKAGLDLPLRVLVWDDGGTTRIGYLSVDALQARYAIEGADEALTTMTGALDKLTSAAASQ